MNTRRLPASWLPAILFGILTNIAHAQLGGFAASADTASVTDSHPAVRHAMFNGAATARTTIDDGGATIVEYADSTGRIFAYTWSGPTMPDLRALLGAYLDDYRSGARKQADAQPQVTSLHASHIAAGGVVVDSGGRMRAYVGRAWLPAALPPGITPADLH